MILGRENYLWFYDHIHSHYYNFLIKYCFLPFGGEKCCRRRLIEDVSFAPDETIVDLCCGTGGATAVIAESVEPNCRIIGLDLSTGQIRVASRQHTDIAATFLVGDAAAAPLPDNSHDKVMIAHALHEMRRRERIKVLQESFRILRPGGQLIVLDLDRPGSPWLRIFVGFWLFYWLPFNFETPTRRDMLKHGLATEVAAVGFSKVRKLSKYSGVFQVVIGVKRGDDQRGDANSGRS